MFAGLVLSIYCHGEVDTGFSPEQFVFVASLFSELRLDLTLLASLTVVAYLNKRK